MGQTQTIGKTATTVYTQNGYTFVKYHRTDVVMFNHHSIVLNSGGWDTATTKNRMNQTSNQFDLGFQVFQKDWNWFVDFKGDTLEFSDGMLLDR
jgi:hypothetical protein